MSPRTQPQRPATGARQILASLLEEGPVDADLVSAYERRVDEGHGPHAALVYVLAHVTCSERQAQSHWRRVRAHRRRLAAELGRDPGLRVAILDHFVNVSHRMRSPKLIEMSQFERTARSAVTDGMTGLYNHAHFLDALGRELQRASRHGRELGLALFDLDDFKKLNDTCGHLEGDRVLCGAARAIRSALRDIDVPARYGGEEFAVILPDTSRLGALVVAERIRRRIQTRFGRRRRGRVTVSGGVAVFPDDAASVEELIARADASLYVSKSAGKNRITLAAGERRQHARVDVGLAVTLRALRRRRSGRASNVSAGGVGLRIARPLPVGTRLRVEIQPRSGAALGLDGEVVRVTPASGAGPFELGLRLFEAPPAALLAPRSA